MSSLNTDFLINSSLHISMDPETVALLLERVCMPDTRVSYSPEVPPTVKFLSLKFLEVVEVSALRMGKAYLLLVSMTEPIPLKATGWSRVKTGVWRSVSSLKIFELMTTSSFICHLLCLGLLF